MKVRDAWELPVTERADLPPGAEWWSTVKQPIARTCGRTRTIYRAQGSDPEWYAGPWREIRPNAIRVTIDEDVYEGRVSNPGDALFAVMRLRESRGPSDSGETRLVAFEPICGARHAKMTKVSE